MTDVSALISSERIIAIARRLIAAASPNPPGDTHDAAVAAADAITEYVPEAEVSLHLSTPPITNLVARISGGAPGRRLILNGHLDTYPVNETLPWTVDPLGGLVADGRLYGRGAADMKGGIAASIAAFAALAKLRDLWRGEVVLTLAGDEESMGQAGTAWLMEHIAHARGDAAIIGDAGSPQVIRFGEKGFLWVELETSGRASHGAHVHLGINALDRMRRAFDAIAAVKSLPVDAPDIVRNAIAAASARSERLSGPGETETLQQVTVNFGYCQAGSSMNLVPASARAGADIRLPVGVSAAAAEAALTACLTGIGGLAWRVLRRVEPNFTPPDANIVQCVAHAASEILNQPPAINMRVGGSDARLFRQAGIPTVVYGPTPFNMGAADEYVLVNELYTVAGVHALAALRFLAPGAT